MTIILDKYVRVCFFSTNTNTIKIKLEFMHMCVRGDNFAHVSMIFSIIYMIWSNGVVYLVIHFINQIRNVLRLIKNLLYCCIL